MILSPFSLEVAVACGLVLMACVLFLRHKMSGEEEWTGPARVLASVLLAAGLFAAGLAQRLHDLQAPLTKVTGVVEFISMGKSSSLIDLRLTDGSLLKLGASDDYEDDAANNEVTATTLFVQKGDVLQASYLGDSQSGVLMDAVAFRKDGTYRERYVAHRGFGNIWMLAAAVALLSGFVSIKSFFPETPRRPQAKVGDNVAETFTADDLPGAHWQFADDPDGRVRFATEEEKDAKRKDY